MDLLIKYLMLVQFTYLVLSNSIRDGHEARQGELGARRVNPIPDSLASFSTLEQLARHAA